MTSIWFTVLYYSHEIVIPFPRCFWITREKLSCQYFSGITLSCIFFLSLPEAILATESWNSTYCTYTSSCQYCNSFLPYHELSRFFRCAFLWLLFGRITTRIVFFRIATSLIAPSLAIFIPNQIVRHRKLCFLNEIKLLVVIRMRSCFTFFFLFKFLLFWFNHLMFLTFLKK